eukprot:241750_1
MKCLLVVAIVVALASSANALNVGALDCTTPCTHTQCKSTTCVTADPYACVAGSAKGGCAINAGWFSNTSSCTSCCDISGCAITCPPCSASECEASVCTSKDPYVCTEGQDKKGCAPSANDWKINPGCSKCCDLASCPTPPPTPKPTPVPAVKLSCKKSCGDLCKNAKTCGVSTPYMCTAGNASFGCLKNDAWFEPACTDCCDVSMCPQTACGACSASTCKNTHCNYLNPFICTKGTLSGGCSSSKSFWPGSPDCDQCCDLQKC